MRTYQWAVGIILALLVTFAGAYIGLVIKNNDREHIEMKQSIKGIQRAINMMRYVYPRAPWGRQ